MTKTVFCERLLKMSYFDFCGDHVLPQFLKANGSRAEDGLVEDIPSQVYQKCSFVEVFVAQEKIVRSKSNNGILINDTVCP